VFHVGHREDNWPKFEIHLRKKECFDTFDPNLQATVTYNKKVEEFERRKVAKFAS
jgi:hypothetical protein